MARSSPPRPYTSARISPASPPYLPCISGALEPASPAQRLAAPPLHTRPAALPSAAQLRKLAATLEESFVAAMAAGARGGAGAGDHGGGEGGGEEAAALAVSALEEGALCRELESDESSSASSCGGGGGGGEEGAPAQLAYASEADERGAYFDDEYECDLDEDDATAAATVVSTALPDYQYIDGLTASEDDDDDIIEEAVAPRRLAPLAADGISGEAAEQRDMAPRDVASAVQGAEGSEPAVPVAGRVFGSSFPTGSPSRAGHGRPRPAPVSPAAASAARTPPASPGRYDYEEEVHERTVKPPVSPGRYDYEEEVHARVGVQESSEKPPGSPGRYDYEEAVEEGSAAAAGRAPRPSASERTRAARATSPPAASCSSMAPSANAANAAAAAGATPAALEALLAQLDALKEQTELSLRGAVSSIERPPLSALEKQRASDELSRALGGF